MGELFNLRGTISGLGDSKTFFSGGRRNKLMSVYIRSGSGQVMTVSNFMENGRYDDAWLRLLTKVEQTPLKSTLAIEIFDCKAYTGRNNSNPLRNYFTYNPNFSHIEYESDDVDALTRHAGKVDFVNSEMFCGVCLKASTLRRCCSRSCIKIHCVYTESEDRSVIWNVLSGGASDTLPSIGEDIEVYVRQVKGYRMRVTEVDATWASSMTIFRNRERQEVRLAAEAQGVVSTGQRESVQTVNSVTSGEVARESSEAPISRSIIDRARSLL